MPEYRYMLHLKIILQFVMGQVTDGSGHYLTCLYVWQTVATLKLLVRVYEYHQTYLVFDRL